MNKHKLADYRYSNIAMFNWFLGRAQCHRESASFATNQVMRRCYRNMMRDNALRATYYLKCHMTSLSHGN